VNGVMANFEMRVLLILIVLAVRVAACAGQDAVGQQGAGDAAPPKPIPIPSDAVRWGYADAEANVYTSSTYRYLFTIDNSPETLATASYVCNLALSHAAKPIVAVEPVKGSNRHLLRVDLKRLAPFNDGKDLQHLIDTWEKFAPINYYFHSINPNYVGRGTVKTTEKQQFEAQFNFSGKLQWVKVDFVRSIDPETVLLLKEGWNNGKAFTHPARLFREADPLIIKEFIDPAPKYIPALHLAGDDRKGIHRYERLQLLTGSDTPIMRLDHFFSLVLREARGKASDGFYYDFRNIPTGKDGLTDEQAWLKSVGGDAKIAENLRTDERAVMWRRRLNDRPAAFEWFATQGTHVSLGPGIAIMTRDFGRRDTDATVHPVYNVLNYKHDASEAFATLPNGFIEFVLFDGNGKIQKVAPPDIAIDSSPSNHSPVEVEVAHSCIRCHGPVGMYHPLSNHAHLLLETKLNIFDDEASKFDVEETIARIGALFGGEPMEVVRAARLTHAKAAFIATGGIFGLNTVTKVTAKTSGIFDQYYYGQVTPKIAAAEIGWRCSTEMQARKILKEQWPAMPLNDLGFSPESPAAQSLKFAEPDSRAQPNREDWEREYANLMLRSINTQIRKKRGEGHDHDAD